MLEGILRDAPNDSATNHYRIHAIEPGNHPEARASECGAAGQPGADIGHMVHMPGHIYYRVGNYAEAERWFSASMAADEHYMQEQHVGPDDDWNYVHNMMYSIANLMEQGRLADANTLSDHWLLARGQLSASLLFWSARDQTGAHQPAFAGGTACGRLGCGTRDAERRPDLPKGDKGPTSLLRRRPDRSPKE